MEGVHDWTMKNSTPATEQKLKSTTDQNRDKNETAQNVNEQKINMYSVTENESLSATIEGSLG